MRHEKSSGIVETGERRKEINLGVGKGREIKTIDTTFQIGHLTLYFQDIVL